jgi:pyruvate/2-oxoglutarate dehydrogenase complex dihydrolipoamide dehydrogenase (E3) component
MHTPRQLTADDPHDRLLLQQVRPADWINPQPAPRYHLVVLGGGTAGLVTAAAAAGLGARVALVEAGLMGGDCLVHGCVPSKALLAAAHHASSIHRSADYGVRIDGKVEVDFAAVMSRLRRLRAEISPHDSAARFRSLGVDVFFARGRFSGLDSIDADGVRLNFSRAVIATGSRPAVPTIPGLSEVGGLTSDTLFQLTELPRRLVVIGGGPIGMEMAQAFASCGATVTVIESGPRILPRDDFDAAAILQQRLVTHHGIRILTNAHIRTVSRRGSDRVLAVEVSGGESSEVVCDELLVATGRVPRIEGLQTELAGIETDLQRGVIVNDRLQTTNPAVYAAGDICSDRRFTHAADFMARIVVRNSLFGGRSRVSSLLIPWCTYTSPEIAHVGLTAEAAAADSSICTLTQPFSGNDRAVLEGRTEGFVRVHFKRGSDQILGATVVGERAGDLISEITVAMAAGCGLKRLASVIHPYPTCADAIRRLGDQYNRTRLTPFVQRLFRMWLKWRF